MTAIEKVLFFLFEKYKSYSITLVLVRVFIIYLTTSITGDSWKLKSAVWGSWTADIGFQLTSVFLAMYRLWPLYLTWMEDSLFLYWCILLFVVFSLQTLPTQSMSSFMQTAGRPYWKKMMTMILMTKTYIRKMDMCSICSKFFVHMCIYADMLCKKNNM